MNPHVFGKEITCGFNTCNLRGVWGLISRSTKKSTNNLRDVSVYEQAFFSG